MSTTTSSPHLGHLRLDELRLQHVTRMLIDIRTEHDERIAAAKEINAKFQIEADAINAERTNRRYIDTRKSLLDEPAPIRALRHSGPRGYSH